MDEGDGVGLVFAHPASIIVAGPSKCGKTHLVKRVLEHDLFHPMPDRVVVAYSEWQPIYEEMRRAWPGIEFVEGFSDSVYEAFSPRTRNLVILDDQMREAGKRGELMDLFTKGSHHRNLSVIYIVQNVYDKGSSMRTASLNADYLVVFRNVRDKTQVGTLSRQMFPSANQFLPRALDSVAHDNPRAYLVIDLSPQMDERLKVRTGIFPNERLAFFVPDERVQKGERKRSDSEDEKCQLVEILPAL